MTGSRIRMIRLCRGWKQSTAAEYMNITQQAYSSLEKGNSAPRIDTLKKVCSAFNVCINFLLAFDVPVTQENIDKYGNWEFGSFINEQKILEQKIAFLNKPNEKEYLFDTVDSRLIAHM